MGDRPKCRCGHDADEHGGVDRDRHPCSRCSCEDYGWDTKPESALEAEIPEVQVWEPGDESMSPRACPVCASLGTGEGMWTHLDAFHPGESLAIRRAEAGKLREEISSAAPEEGSLDIHEALMRANRRVTALLYLLMRDEVPTGKVAEMCQTLAGMEEYDFTAHELAELAGRYCGMLFGTKVEVVPKAEKDWMGMFPARIRESKHFKDVVASEGRRDERTAVAVTREVVKRQRAERDAQMQGEQGARQGGGRIVGD